MQRAAAARSARPLRSLLLISSQQRAALGCAAILLVGLAVRLAVIHSPAGALDADEAVVGLMARRIAFGGERPVFFYGQTYLGSLEPFSAAPLFAVFDSSAELLKLVPTLYSLAFLGVSAALAWRLFGPGPALISAAYLAVPPAMLALWSQKARGGYAEMLFLGELLLLLTVRSANSEASFLGGVIYGLIAGLAVWTHPLSLVFVVPTAAYLVAARPRAVLSRYVPAGALGLAVGAAPLLSAALVDGFPTITQISDPAGAGLRLDPWLKTLCLTKESLPTLLGLLQPQTVDATATGCGPPVGVSTFAGLAIVAVITAAFAFHVATLGREQRKIAALLLGPVLVLAFVLLVSPLPGDMFPEPRYALPFYAAVPLLAAAAWRLPLALRAMTVGAVLALNAWSLAVMVTHTDAVIPRDESTAANRVELMRWLVARDRHQVHTDYWTGFPLMFESREVVLAEIVAGGPNRYLPYAENVAETPDAAWVFVRGSAPDATFQLRLGEAGATVHTDDVSVYRVYTGLSPQDAITPPL